MAFRGSEPAEIKYARIQFDPRVSKPRRETICRVKPVRLNFKAEMLLRALPNHMACVLASIKP